MEAKQKAAISRQMLLGDEANNPDAGKDILLTEEEAILLGQVKGGPGFQRIMFGMKVGDAIRSGYRITRKGYFESTGTAAADNTSQVLKELLDDNDELPLLEPFGGIGSNTWSFASHGLRVAVVEKHQFTYDCLVNNITQAGLTEKVITLPGDGDFFMKSQILSGSRFSGVYLDPPWNGSYKYDLSKPFRFENMDPNADLLIRAAIEIAPVVSLKVPQNIDTDEVRFLGENLGCGTMVHYQNVEGRIREFTQATVYFLRNMEGHTQEQISITPPLRM